MYKNNIKYVLQRNTGFKPLDTTHQIQNLVSYIVYIKPAHVVTSIKQPPVLKGHLFFVLS